MPRLDLDPNTVTNADTDSTPALTDGATYSLQNRGPGILFALSLPVSDAKPTREALIAADSIRLTEGQFSPIDYNKSSSTLWCLATGNSGAALVLLPSA